MWRSLVLLSMVAISRTLAEAPSPSYGPPGFNPGTPTGPGGQGGYSGGGGGGGGYGNGGNGGGGDEEGKPEPFSFQYEVNDPQSGTDFSHRADSDGSKVTGEYKVLLPDGRRQLVTYTADQDGYKADVKYEGEASSGGAGGSGGYPSGGPSGGFGGSSGGNGGYPSGAPSGFGGNNGGNDGFGGNNGGNGGSGGFGGYPSSSGGGSPSNSYLPPGK